MMIPKRVSDTIPKSYIDFKNKWVNNERRKKSKEPSIKKWNSEKNLERKEIKQLRKEKNKYSRRTRNKLGKQMKKIDLRIRSLNRRISSKKRRLNKPKKNA